MATLGQTPTSTTTGSGVGNAFPFNRGDDPEPVSGVSETNAGDDAPTGAESTEVSEAEIQAQAEASRHGWMAQDAWVADGRDPKRWRPASEFLEVRRGITTVVQEENAALKTKLATLEQKLVERERKEAEAHGKFTLETLQLERKQARENGDWDKVDQLDNQIFEQRLKQTTAAQVPAQPTMPPELQQTLIAFRNDNQTIFKDPDLTVDFTVRLKSIVDSGVVQDMGKALQHAKRMVMRDNPDKFRARVNGQTQRSPMAEMGGNNGSAAAAQSWTRLKPEYRKVAEKDIKNGLYSKEEYLAQCDDNAFMR